MELVTLISISSLVSHNTWHMECNLKCLILKLFCFFTNIHNE